MIKIDLSGQAPSANKLYFQRGYSRIKTNEYRAWEDFVRLAVGRQTVFSEGPVRVSIELWDSWYTKQHKVLRKDLDNYIKATLDAVSSAIGLEDSRIFELSAKKVHSPLRQRTIIRISLI